jgi:hypothetical protein
MQRGFRARARCRPATNIESSILKPARLAGRLLLGARRWHGYTQEVPLFRSVDATLRCRGKWWKETACGCGRIQLKTRGENEGAPASPEGPFTHNIFGLELAGSGIDHRMLNRRHRKPKGQGSLQPVSSRPGSSTNCAHKTCRTRSACCRSSYCDR